MIDCRAGERKHRIAEEYLAEHPDVRAGVFLILVARSPALVWKRSITAPEANTRFRLYS